MFNGIVFVTDILYFKIWFYCTLYNLFVAFKSMMCVCYFVLWFPSYFSVLQLLPVIFAPDRSSVFFCLLLVPPLSNSSLLATRSLGFHYHVFSPALSAFRLPYILQNTWRSELVVLRRVVSLNTWRSVLEVSISRRAVSLNTWILKIR